jgi:sugar lactone lactonase YvrE
LEVLCKNINELGEGPTWDPKKKVLYWIDITKSKIFQYNPADKSTKSWNTDSHIGSLALKESGGLVLALKDGFYDFDLDSGKQTCISIADNDPNRRFNDGKCDPSGRFWAGTMHYDEAAPLGSLYCLDSTGEAKCAFDSVFCSNGLAWSVDKTQFYYIDSQLHRVDVFDYDDQNGRLSNRRVAIELKEAKGFPDGCTIDAEGMLWVAFWEGGRIDRYNPKNAELIETLVIPGVEKVTSCTFGGENLDDLYITTASIGYSPEELKKQENAGSLLRIKINHTKGLLTNYYRA